MSKQHNIEDLDDELSITLQQRADYIPLEDLSQETASSGILFKSVIKELTNRGLRTIVGPRGCGKTHMMRFAWLTARNNTNKPFAVFASFQRYFRLEPLLSSNVGAAQLFHSWVLTRILLSTKESYDAWSLQPTDIEEMFLALGYSTNQLLNLANRLERNQPLDTELTLLSESLSIDKIKWLIDLVTKKLGRKHAVILMDDAAMTLTPDYLIEFLDIVRSLKSTTISPKASVYPGTTEMSPRFHEGQDSIAIPVWISVEDSQYDEIMQEIALVRVKQLSNIPEDVQAILRFASFGIPRAYLTMLEEYQRNDFKTPQQGVNRIINDHLAARISEFRSLGTKIPKFGHLVNTGEIVLNEITKELKNFNTELLKRHEKELVYGIRRDKLFPLLERMFKLLIEAGLIYDDGEIKHGTPARIYRKFIPHTASMLNVGAFNVTGKSGSIKQTLEAVGYKSTKHPLRKDLANIVDKELLNSLDLALPRCAFCQTSRLSDNQRFCHNCGHQLVDASTFNQCLEAKITDVPGLSSWQRARIEANLPLLRTIRDYLAKQDPAAELLTISGFGSKRTAKIIDILNSFIDDYLS